MDLKLIKSIEDPGRHLSSTTAFRHSENNFGLIRIQSSIENLMKQARREKPLEPLSYVYFGSEHGEMISHSQRSH